MQRLEVEHEAKDPDLFMCAEELDWFLDNLKHNACMVDEEGMQSVEILV
jgi:hypothetical protein